MVLVSIYVGMEKYARKANYSILFKQYHVCKRADMLSTTAQNDQFGIDCLYPINNKVILT